MTVKKRRLFSAGLFLSLGILALASCASRADTTVIVDKPVSADTTFPDLPVIRLSEGPAFPLEAGHLGRRGGLGGMSRGIGGEIRGVEQRLPGGIDMALDVGDRTKNIGGELFPPASDERVGDRDGGERVGLDRPLG